MLTRHFYPREGVGDALLASLGPTKDPLRKQKVLFWAYELVLSEEEEFLWKVLERAVDLYGSSEEDRLLTDRSLLPLLASLTVSWPTAYAPPSSIPCKIPPGLPETPSAWTEDQRARLWWAVQDAKQHKRPERLLRLLGSLPPAVAAQYLQTKKEGWRRMLEAVDCPWFPTVRPVQWPKLQEGRLSARLFALPKSALFKEPMHPAGWDVWAGCAVWKRVLKEAGAKDPGQFASMEQEEAFYSTYFPDDIPDEWSTAERTKSHVCSLA